MAERSGNAEAKQKSSTDAVDYSYAIDSNGNITDKRIEAEVADKVDWYYVQERLYGARMDVKRLELYKRKIAEVNTALEQEDVERAIAAMYYDENRELSPDPLEEKLKRYWATDVDSPVPWKTTEERKQEARKVYQEKGITGFQRLAKLHTEIYFESESIDDSIQKAKAELSRMENIVNNHSSRRAHRLLHGYGDCHYEWGIKKQILKVDYGIDWKTPDERFPGIRFD